MNELEFRRDLATVTDVDTKQRLVDVVAVPYEQTTEVLWRGEEWREVFERGAFHGIEERAGKVRVNREHVKGDTIGKIVHFENTDDGLFARIKIANTPRGEETLALAEEDMISASVGFRVKFAKDMFVDGRNKIRRVKRAFLDHLAMVESPAYEGAQVLAVREEQSAPAADRAETPAINEFLSDEVLLWAAERSRQHVPDA